MDKYGYLGILDLLVLGIAGMPEPDEMLLTRGIAHLGHPALLGLESAIDLNR